MSKQKRHPHDSRARREQFVTSTRARARLSWNAIVIALTAVVGVIILAIAFGAGGSSGFTAPGRPAEAVLTDRDESLPVKTFADGQEAPAPPDNVVKTFKQTACGCCEKWIEHMKRAGFTIESEDVDSLDTIKAKYNVPMALRTCHTTLVDGYVVEGHVPPDVIVTLLRERPDIAGIGVAGMPDGSPGMESTTPEPYDVLAFRDGDMTVFARR